MVFGERIKKVAKDVGGIEQLSKIAKISKRVISQYISGQSEPTRPKLLAIAQAGNVSIEWLATGNVTANQNNADLNDVKNMILILDEWLEKQGVILPREKKAELIVFLLEEHAGKDFDFERVETIKKHISHMVKMAK